MINICEIDSISKEASVEDLIIIISEILKSVDYSTIMCYNQTFDGLYRARKHNMFYGNLQNDNIEYHFKSEKEFWHPTKDTIQKRGRCNDIGESLFYSSNEFETAILEVKPEVGKFITVANFLSIKKNGKLPTFRIKPVCIQHLQNIEGTKSCIKEFDLSIRDKKFLKVDDFLDALFTENVTEEFEYRYKTTIAITKCMLANILNGNGDEFSMNGMIYPSMARNNKSVNILLKPIYVENNFKIKNLQTFKVVEKLNNGYLLQLVRSGILDGEKDHPSIKLEIVWEDIINVELTEV